MLAAVGMFLPLCFQILPFIFGAAVSDGGYVPASVLQNVTVPFILYLVLLLVTVGMFLLLYTGLLGVWQGTFRTDWHALYNVNVFLARKFNELKLIINVVFSHPPGKRRTVVTVL